MPVMTFGADGGGVPPRYAEPAISVELATDVRVTVGTAASKVLIGATLKALWWSGSHRAI